MVFGDFLHTTTCILTTLEHSPSHVHKQKANKEGTEGYIVQNRINVISIQIQIKLAYYYVYTSIDIFCLSLHLLLDFLFPLLVLFSSFKKKMTRTRSKETQNETKEVKVNFETWHFLIASPYL